MAISIIKKMSYCAEDRQKAPIHRNMNILAINECAQLNENDMTTVFSHVLQKSWATLTSQLYMFFVHLAPLRCTRCSSV